MRKFRLLPFALVTLFTFSGEVHPANANSYTNPEIAYLKEVNAWAPTDDPQLLLILMSEFSNAGRQLEGIAYFEQLLTAFGSTLTPVQHAQYLIAIASLRAGRASEVFVLNRITWVKDTLKILDHANGMTGSQLFVGRWMSGIVRSQIPVFFGERTQARTDLEWCLQNMSEAPHYGWLREVYFALARLDDASGDTQASAKNLALSGYPDLAKNLLLTTPFSHTRAQGHSFSPKSVRAVIPGVVYVVSGFEFTEFYFVVTQDGKQLVSIDAGTRGDSAKAALDALKDSVPNLPPLSTVFVTHAHWDHVGGHAYFRQIYPEVRFIGRANYQDELAHDAGADIKTLKQFFGDSFRLEDVLSYKADLLVDKPTTLIIGGTQFQLLPTQGGETQDAMLIHLPAHKVVFAGDILMPYLGAPFVEEGDVNGMLAAITQVVELHSSILLHGHEPLTRIFNSSAMLVELKDALVWLDNEVLRKVKSGAERSAIHENNLVAPSLKSASANAQLAYLVLRENVINRVFDQNTGYWQSGVKGLDHLSDRERGSVLTDYLKVSEGQVKDAVTQMLADGHHELAASTLQIWRARNSTNHNLDELYRQANQKLMEKYQEFNPFKFIIYGAEAQQETRQMEKPLN